MHKLVYTPTLLIIKEELRCLKIPPNFARVQHFQLYSKEVNKKSLNIQLHIVSVMTKHGFGTKTSANGKTTAKKGNFISSDCWSRIQEPGRRRISKELPMLTR